MSEYAKQLLIKRSRVIAGARSKLPELKKQMETYKDDKHILVYCGATTIKDADAEDMDFGGKSGNYVCDGERLAIRTVCYGCACR